MISVPVFAAIPADKVAPELIVTALLIVPVPSSVPAFNVTVPAPEPFIVPETVKVPPLIVVEPV